MMEKAGKAALTALLMISVTPAFAGYSYRFTTTTRNAMGEHVLAGRTLVDGPRMRIEFTKGDGVLFHDGSWLFSADSGKSLTLVDPASRHYSSLELGDLLRTAGAAIKTLGGGEPAFTAPNVVASDRGDGGQIAGYPTRRRKVDSRFYWTIKLMGETVTTHVDVSNETWTTTALPAELTTFIQMPGFTTGVESIDRILSQQTGSAGGFPLRQVTTTTTTTGTRRTVTASETDISAVTKTDLASSLFRVPPGYKKE